MGIMRDEMKKAVNDIRYQMQLDLNTIKNSQGANADSVSKIKQQIDQKLASQFSSGTSEDVK